MLTKLSHCFSRKSVITALCFALLCCWASASPVALAEGTRDVRFFDGQDIDYWNEGKQVKPFVPQARPLVEKPHPLLPSGSLIRQRDALPFDWTKYEDPKNPEFWDDGGDYVAPRPLREAVANPTQENLEKYADWQARRVAVLAEFNRKLILQNSTQKVASSSAKQTRSVESRSPLNLKEVQLLYFYQSSCPHCQAAKAQVEELRRKGLSVTFIQLDSDESPPLHQPSVKYSSALSKQFAVSATPTWVFRRRESSVRLQGAQSDEEIRREISRLFASSASPALNQQNSMKGVVQ